MDKGLIVNGRKTVRNKYHTFCIVLSLKHKSFVRDVNLCNHMSFLFTHTLTRKVCNNQIMTIRENPIIKVNRKLNDFYRLGGD